MKNIFLLLLASLLSISDPALGADLKISQLPDGGTISATDQIPVNKGGTTSRVVVGSAATKATSNASKATVAAVNGVTVTDNICTFADTAGTVKDSGKAIGNAAAKGVSDNTKANVASISGSITSGNLTVFADTSGTVSDGGVKGTVVGKAASDVTKASVASVSGATVANNLAVFNDTGGTVKDGGSPLVVRPISAAGTGWNNTGISTALEVCLVSVALPAMATQDQIRVNTLWTVGGTATNTKTLSIRLHTASCTPQATTSTGTQFMAVVMNTSSLITAQLQTIIANRNATNSQVVFPAASQNGLTSASAITTGAVQTNATPFVNITCRTNTATADSCKLEAYSIELIKP